MQPGSEVKRMDAKCNVVPVYVTDVHQVKRAKCRRIDPLDAGGVITHNPRDGQDSNNANDPVILATQGFVAGRLVAAPTPSSTTHGYSLRPRRPTDRSSPRVYVPALLHVEVSR